VGNTQQTMPTALPAGQRVAAGPYVPPNDIGSNAQSFVQSPQLPPVGQGSIVSQDLPALSSSTVIGNSAMPAAPSLAPVTAAPRAPVLTAPAPQVAAAPSLTVVPQNGTMHTIESGESLYSIARKYDVTAQAIVQANGFSSPDRIFVGQQIVIPGKPGAPRQQVASIEAPAPARHTTQTAPTSQPASTAAVAPQQPAPAAPVAQPEQPAPQQTANLEPKMSAVEKFRWPISGKVIVDFGASKGTGINIEAPEGAPVRAAENGTVIYVGSGVEGYGNLILIRHANGYVSAYAHLKSMSVQKGDVVNRGDNIGQAGMTGSVNRPQLHFELRKGATPVDPIPLLAG
jgi:murein DD-endopeptidase MepM/ murein hydrolase activator NlpD